MKSRAVNLSAEQIAYRNSILQKKRRAKNESFVKKPELKKSIERMVLEKRIQYLKNCMFWFNHFLDGSTDENKFYYTLWNIENHCKEMRQEIYNARK